MLTSVPSDTEVILRQNLCQHNLVRKHMGHPVPEARTDLGDVDGVTAVPVPAAVEAVEALIVPKQGSEVLLQIVTLFILNDRCKVS